MEMLDYTTAIGHSQPKYLLIEHHKHIYKFKILFNDVRLAQNEVIKADVELVIRAVLLQLQRHVPLVKAIEANNFMFRCSEKKWGIADEYSFIDHGELLKSHRTMFVFNVYDKPGSKHGDASITYPVMQDNEDIIHVDVEKHRALIRGSDNKADQRSMLGGLEDEEVTNLFCQPVLEADETNDDAIVPEMQHYLESGSVQSSTAQSVPTNHPVQSELTIIAQSKGVGSTQTSSVPYNVGGSVQTSSAQSAGFESTQSIQAVSVSPSTHLQTFGSPLFSFTSGSDVTHISSQFKCSQTSFHPADILPLFLTKDTPQGQQDLTQVSPESTTQLGSADIDTLAGRGLLTPSHPLDILSMFQTVTPSYSPFIPPLSPYKEPLPVFLDTSKVTRGKVTPPPLPLGSSCVSSLSRTPPNLPRIPPVLETLPTNRTDYSLRLRLKAGSHSPPNRKKPNKNNSNADVMFRSIGSSTKSPIVSECIPITSNQSTRITSKYVDIVPGTTLQADEDDDDCESMFKSSSSMLPPSIGLRRSSRLCQSERNVERRKFDEGSVIESERVDEADKVVAHHTQSRLTQNVIDKTKSIEVNNGVVDDDDGDDDGETSNNRSTRNVECQTTGGRNKKVSSRRMVCLPEHVSPKKNSNTNEHVEPCLPLRSPVKRRSLIDNMFYKLKKLF